MSRALWLVANGAMFTLFALAVLVQINDPDAWRWMLFYGAAALVCLLAFRARLRRWLPALVGALALAWAVSIAPRVVGKVPFLAMFEEFEMKNLAIEEAREMYGLLLVAGWMMVIALRGKARRGH